MVQCEIILNKNHANLVYNQNINNNNNQNDINLNNNNLICETFVNNLNYNKNINIIKEFYSDTVILITGGTGFLGKVLIEKLLRTCTNILNIYILVRPKRGLTSEQRCQHLKENQIFDRIRSSNPQQLSKLICIAGDISQKNIGLSINDQKRLIENVNVVFHAAATVRFDENIKNATNLNTLGSQRLFDICCRMIKLKSVIHVSTAYSNATKRNVEEIVYPSKKDMDVNTFLKCANVLSNDLINSIASELQGTHPNTYTLTKSLGEQSAADYYHKLPISIIRPSIVTAAVEEPYPGWVDNLNGITGVMTEIGRGTVSSIMCNQNLTLDLIPVDIACNMMITAAWLNYYKPSNSIRVYNCTSGQINPIKYYEFHSSLIKWARNYPTKYVMLYPNFKFRKNRCIHLFFEIFFHFLPAILFDLFLIIQKRKPMMLNIAKRCKSSADTGEFFTMHEWNFEVTNVKQLIKEIDVANDGNEFYCDVSTIDWDEYLKIYMLGIRKYILKDDLESLEDARKTIKRLFIGKWIIKMCFIFLMYVFISSF